MNFISKSYLKKMTILFFAISSYAWSSDGEIHVEGDHPSNPHIQPQAQASGSCCWTECFSCFPCCGNPQGEEDDLENGISYEERLKRDAEKSDYNSRTTYRRWYSVLGKVYGFTGEALKISSSLLDVACVIAAGVAATYYDDDPDAAKTWTIVAGLSEVTSIAFDKLGSRSKKASRSYWESLEKLNNEDRGLAVSEENEEPEEDEEEDL